MAYMDNGASSVERALIEWAKGKKAPINGSLELLPLCNMNCDMCYVRLSREEMEQKGRLRTADEWLEIGRQAVDRFKCDSPSSFCSLNDQVIGAAAQIRPEQPLKAVIVIQTNCFK